MTPVQLGATTVSRKKAFPGGSFPVAFFFGFRKDSVAHSPVGLFILSGSDLCIAVVSECLGEPCFQRKYGLVWQVWPICTLHHHRILEVFALFGAEFGQVIAFRIVVVPLVNIYHLLKGPKVVVLCS